MRMVQVALGERSYPIYIGSNIWPALPEQLQAVVKPGKALLISDEHVFPLYGGKTVAALDQAGFTVTPAVVGAGEDSKSLGSADALYTAAIEAGLDRDGVIVALGGGVVGDLAGFVASTYLRGVPLIQIPTTLLAQVDSSVGGKVAVNHRLGKNLIGSFYQPRLVWAELSSLSTLPAREFLAGAAEVVKYGAILSEPFLRYLEEQWDSLLAQETGTLTEVVGDCCALKARVVSDDEREGGVRAILNFGHTLGHALEAATGYRHYLHGEAVLAGMVLAVRLAVGLSVLKREEGQRLLSLYARIGLRGAPGGLTAAQVMDALQYDKKREGETLVFILPVTVGAVKAFRDVPMAAVQLAVSQYLEPTCEGSLLSFAD